jgi:hypothetical protein
MAPATRTAAAIQPGPHVEGVPDWYRNKGDHEPGQEKEHLAPLERDGVSVECARDIGRDFDQGRVVSRTLV